jgi:hypothetical protein
VLLYKGLILGVAVLVQRDCLTSSRVQRLRQVRECSESSTGCVGAGSAARRAGLLVCLPRARPNEHEREQKGKTRPTIDGRPHPQPNTSRSTTILLDIPEESERETESPVVDSFLIAARPDPSRRRSPPPA